MSKVLLMAAGMVLFAIGTFVEDPLTMVCGTALAIAAISWELSDIHRSLARIYRALAQQQELLERGAKLQQEQAANMVALGKATLRD